MSRRALVSLHEKLAVIKEEPQSDHVARDFLNDLKRAIELVNEADSRPPSKTYKPSSMACIRNMYYQVSGAEQDAGATPYTLVGICNSGTDIHDRTQRYVEAMKDLGYDCEYVDVGDYVREHGLDRIEIISKQGMETKLYHKTYNMSFLCDGIIKYKGKYYILELKTESSYKWQKREGVDPKHYAQGTAYSIAFDIDQVIFVYINRDILDMKAFMFEPTKEMKRGLISRILKCDGYLQEGKLPPKPKDVLKSTCQYCSYRERCKKDEKEKVAEND